LRAANNFFALDDPPAIEFAQSSGRHLRQGLVDIRLERRKFLLPDRALGLPVTQHTTSLAEA
jgi:hypothetical protein